MAKPDADSPREEVEELLVACQDRLLTRIRWMMGDQARRTGDSGDFLGEVMTRILEGLQSLEWRDENHFLSLATRIARNTIVDRIRRPRVQRFESFTANLSAGRVAAPEGQTPSQAAAEGEHMDNVMAALERLRVDHQRVIELRHFEELTFKEIGVLMERSDNAVQILHARAVTELGRLLKKPKD